MALQLLPGLSPHFQPHSGAGSEEPVGRQRLADGVASQGWEPTKGSQWQKDGARRTGIPSYVFSCCSFLRDR